MAGKHLTEVGHGRESAVDDQAIKGSEWVHKGVYLPDCKLGGKKSGNLEGDRECRGGKAWIRSPWCRRIAGAGEAELENRTLGAETVLIRECPSI